MKLETGKEIYEAGCVACHGPDGRGQPDTTLAVERPDTFPDFTDCAATTTEPDEFWKAIIHQGGPIRGFSPIMPAFGRALTDQQLEKVIGYLRTFCKEESWPRGELNLPRPLLTEKAFPENESVVTTGVNVRGGPGVTNLITHEQRFGVTNQLEVTLPVDFVRPAPGVWHGGFGDLALGWKRALFSSVSTGSILSVQGEVILPTGSRARGLGSGVTTFETFAMYGQILPWKSFVQIQSGGEFPTDTQKAARAFFFRSALGRTFNQNRGMGRLWAPMVELIADREFETDARTNLDVVPQFQATLSTRQHVRANLGVRIPATNTTGRPVQLMFYLLWDRQDGTLTEGW
ncbi:MAG TPA: cytochrome c [Bryobacteraceae bacterium]|nr:cytochrome c [Bryobacteraceae bacterium]